MEQKLQLWGNLRYYSLDYYLKNRFGEKTAKIPINGGFNCPNRDGTLSHTGCIFCSEGSGEFCSDQTDISKQIADLTNPEFDYSITKKCRRTKKIIAYFQAFSSTYATVDILSARYNQALNSRVDGEIVGLSIATRADCIDDEVLDLLCSFNEKTFLTVELGLQTIHEPTRNFINIGYTMECFDRVYNMLKRNNILTTLHIIFGLPNETAQMMDETINYVNNICPFSVKFHQLMVLHGTRLAKLNIETLSQEQYTDLVADSLTKLNQNITIARLVADASKNVLIEPKWSTDKLGSINKINHKLKEKNLWQGKNLT